GRQLAVRNVRVKVGGVLDMSGADSRIGHDRGVVLEGVADVAVLVGVLADRTIVQLVRIVHIVVPLVAVVLPGNIVLDHVVADAGHRRRRNGEDRVVGIGIGVGVLAVAEVAGVVVIQQIVAALLAMRRDRSREHVEVPDDRRDAGLGDVLAVG